MKFSIPIPLTLSILIVVSSIAFSLEPRKQNRRFEKDWPTETDLKWFARAKGKSEKEVLELMGSPTRKESKKGGETRWHYPWMAAAYIDFKDGKAIWTFYTAGF